MTGLGRRGFLLGLGGAILIAGCNFPTAMYFLMPEAKEPAEYKQLASEEDRKKEVKVVLWTYSMLDPRPEFVHADRQLTELLAKQIQLLSEENQEKITIVRPRDVENYKNNHPNWKSMDPTEVGRYFKADYVINLEINNLNLYEERSVDLYRGRTRIQVSLADVKHPEESQSPRPFSDLYPSEARSGIPVMDTNAEEFRQQFLTHAARHLAYWFEPHRKRDSMVME